MTFLFNLMEMNHLYYNPNFPFSVNQWIELILGVLFLYYWTIIFLLVVARIVSLLLTSVVSVALFLCLSISAALFCLTVAVFAVYNIHTQLLHNIYSTCILYVYISRFSDISDSCHFCKKDQESIIHLSYI